MIENSEQAQPGKPADDADPRMDAMQNQLDEIIRQLDDLDVKVTALYAHLNTTLPGSSRK